MQKTGLWREKVEKSKDNDVYKENMKDYLNTNPYQKIKHIEEQLEFLGY